MSLSLTVGDLKRDFSKVVEKVRLGESITILYGRSKEKLGKIIPYPKEHKNKKRPIGFLKNKISLQFSKDFKINDEEFLKL